MPTPHLSRLDLALRELLHTQRVAALGTVDAQNCPQVSMVPYAIAQLPQSSVLVLHVSGLAAHTRHLEARPEASLMVMQAEVANQAVHALPRVTFSVRAQTLDSSPPNHGNHGNHAVYAICRAAYLSRFPEVEPMTALPDFRFVMLDILQARHIAGFGAARTIEADEIQRLLLLATTA
jgi:hypothetical protein